MKYRTINAIRDLWDRWVRGYCCWTPSGLPGDAGYHFWRCGRPRGHKGPHRFVNYLITEEGEVYAPTNDPVPRLDRYPARTREQRRALERWHKRAEQARKVADAERRARENHPEWFE